MRKMKYVIGILLLFMVIGFATVTVSLSLSGNARLTSDIGDFKVYFSDVKMNDEQNLTLVKSETEIMFDVLLQEIGTTYKISYDVTNASSMFDANLSVSCTQGDEYVSVINDFDSSTLSALTTRTGDLTIKKLKAYGSDTNKDYTITCSIVASPVERDSQASGEVISPIKPIEISTGDVISIAGENFNVISQTDTTVTMLAQYNLGTDYRQREESNAITFSDSDGWEYSPGPEEIDIQVWAGSSKTYLNEYVAYLETLTRGASVKGDFITLSQLKKLGCTIQDDYSKTGIETCVDSQYAYWLVNGQVWWTRSATPDSSWSIWAVSDDGSLNYFSLGNYALGVRPVITVPIEIARLYYVEKWYSIGEEVAIDDEKFNVISDNGDTITMLAQYNLGTDYRQSEIENTVSFSSSVGWEYTPGPKEIDIQLYDGNAKTYVNGYVSYLQSVTSDVTLSGNLITLSQLKKLDCVITDDYSGDSAAGCVDSVYVHWLNNGQFWWTRSASSTGSFSVNQDVWVVLSSSAFNISYISGTMGPPAGIRPIITISKDYL